MTIKQLKELEENLKLTKIWLTKGNSIHQINLSLMLDDFEKVLKEVKKQDEQIGKLLKEIEKLKSKKQKKASE